MIRAIFLTVAVAMSLPATAQRGPASVFVEPVSTKGFSMNIEALGTLQPNEQVELSLNASDRVTAVYFDDGERVVEGQTLLSLAQREQVALVEAAEASVREARSQLERVERLAAREAVSTSELDEARRDMDSASANLRAVQSRQKDRILVAPFDGVLGFRQVSVGTYLSPGDPVATLIDDSVMKLDFSVPARFLSLLATGTEIQAETDSLRDEIFTGEIRTLNNIIDPITRAVRVRAILPNSDIKLRPGMFMNVTVLADPRVALAIPEEAVQPVGPDNFVYVVAEKDDTLIAERKQVMLGQRQDGMIEVISGLDEKDRIITEGLIRVRNNGPIAIRDKSILTPNLQISGSGATTSGGR